MATLSNKVGMECPVCQQLVKCDVISKKFTDEVIVTIDMTAFTGHMQRHYVEDHIYTQTSINWEALNPIQPELW